MRLEVWFMCHRGGSVPRACEFRQGIEAQNIGNTLGLTQRETAHLTCRNNNQALSLPAWLTCRKQIRIAACRHGLSLGQTFRAVYQRVKRWSSFPASANHRSRGFLCEMQRRVRHTVADTEGNRKTNEKITSVSESFG